MDLEINTESTLELQLIRRAEAAGLPISGTLELLPLCNMNCDMCYVRLSPEEMKGKGRLRTVEEWTAIARQMQKEGVLFLMLTGGEPLLYPGFRELYCKLKKMGMILTVNTNGTLIDEDWADFFQRYSPRRMNVTLYGGSEETYERLCHYKDGFRKTLNGIRLLKERGIAVKINGSAVQANRQELEKIASVGKQLEVPVNIDCYMMPSVRERDRTYNFGSRLAPEEAAAAELFTRRLKLGEKGCEEYRQRMLWTMEHLLPEEEPMHMSCRAGKTSFAINWQGQLQPCVMMKEPSVSVFQSGFAEAWRTVSAGTGAIVLNSRCCSCRLRPLCRTCAACAEMEAGSYDALPEYMCRFAEAAARLLETEDSICQEGYREQ